jgi:membrane associated rhomboid family serine protease
MTTEHPCRPRSFFRSPVGLVLVGFLAIAAFFLLTEHTAHVFGALPYLVAGAKFEPPESQRIGMFELLSRALCRSILLFTPSS